MPIASASTSASKTSDHKYKMTQTGKTKRNTDPTNELARQVIGHICLKEGGYAWRNNTTGIYDPNKRAFRSAAKTGISDILCCWNGRFIGIELKVSKGDRLRPEQQGFILNVQHVGGVVIVVKTFDDFLTQWNELKTMVRPA